MNRRKNVLLISKDDFDVIYHPCCECGNYADDGGLRNGQFTCHECLDNEKNKLADGQKHPISNHYW